LLVECVEFCNSDINWLIKTREGGILVDTGGTSALPFTWQRM
jgi:hypothetical protein